MNLFVLRMKLKALIATSRLRFEYWFFQWKLDQDNDIVFSICNVVHFVKYKQSTIVYWGRQPMFREAPKYLDIKA